MNTLHPAPLFLLCYGHQNSKMIHFIHIEWKFLTQSWINYLIKSLLLQIMVKSFYGILTALAIDPEIGLLFVKQLKQMIWRWPNPPKSNILQEKDYYSVLNTEITFCIISQIREGAGAHTLYHQPHQFWYAELHPIS